MQCNYVMLARNVARRAGWCKGAGNRKPILSSRNTLIEADRHLLRWVKTKTLQPSTDIARQRWGKSSWRSWKWKEPAVTRVLRHCCQQVNLQKCIALVRTEVTIREVSCGQLLSKEAFPLAWISSCCAEHKSGQSMQTEILQPQKAEDTVCLGQTHVYYLMQRGKYNRTVWYWELTAFVLFDKANKYNCTVWYGWL